jgi:hypothetical protein
MLIKRSSCIYEVRLQDGWRVIQENYYAMPSARDRRDA